MDVKAMEEVIEEINHKIEECNSKVSIMRTAEGKAYYEAKILALEAGNKALSKEVERQTKGEYDF